MASTNTNNINEELDNLMDISIEIASNKRMKKDNIKPFRLTFKDKDLEKKVCEYATICELDGVEKVYAGHPR